MMFTNCVLWKVESFSYNLVEGPYSKTYIKRLCTVLAGKNISYTLIKCSKCNIISVIYLLYYMCYFAPKF